MKKIATRRQAAVDRLRALEQSISASYLIEDVLNNDTARVDFHHAIDRILADDHVAERVLTAIFNALWLSHRIGYHDATHPAFDAFS